MNLTIFQPLQQTSFIPVTAQCRREPYKWALGAIREAGGIAFSKLQNFWIVPEDFTQESPKTEEEETSPLAVVFAEFELTKSLEIIMPEESVDLSKIVPDPKLQLIVKKLLQCAAFRNYWDHTLRDGMFRIRYATQTEEKHIMKFAAETHPNRTILLRKHMRSDEATKAILFELGNLQFLKNPVCLEKFSSAEACARHIENQEYESLMNAHQLSACLLEEGLLPCQPWPFQTREQYLALQEKTGHTDLYRARWYDACDPEGGRAWRAAKQKGGAS